MVFYSPLPEEYIYAGFSGRILPDTPFQRFLVRQWIHVTASLRFRWYSDPVIDSRPALRVESLAFVPCTWQSPVQCLPRRVQEYWFFGAALVCLGWFCWCRRTLRYVPFFGSQAQMLASWPVLTRRTVARCTPVVVQKPIPMVFSSEDHRDSPVAPQHGVRCPCCTSRAGSLVSGSHLCIIWCSPVEYRIMDFLGDPRNVPYSALLGSTVDTCSASVYEAF